MAKKVARSPDGLMDVQMTGDSRDIQMRLDALQAAFTDQALYAFMAAVADPLLRHRTAERFAMEGDELSGKWMSLAPATVARRKADHFPGEHPINVRTGEMKRHLLDTPPRIVPHSIGVTMWSPGTVGGKEMVSKVQTAQSGGITPEGRPVPPRPVLGVGPVDLGMLMLAMAGYIKATQPPGVRIQFS